MSKAKVAQAAPAAQDDLNDGAQFVDNGEAVQMIDMSDVPDDAGGFEVLPRGIYDVIVDDVTYGISQRSGNPMWTWVFELESGDYKNRKLFFHTVLTPAQLPRAKKILTFMMPELLASPFSPEQVANEGILLGKRARCRIDIRKYEGEDRNNVRDVLPPNADTGEGFM